MREAVKSTHKPQLCIAPDDSLWLGKDIANGIVTSKGEMERRVRKPHDKSIRSSILVIRGLRVILDAYLALIYGVTISRLNQLVRRDLKRIPPDLCRS